MLTTEIEHIFSLSRELNFGKKIFTKGEKMPEEKCYTFMMWDSDMRRNRFSLFDKKSLKLERN
jgi:hypothetical protein